MENFTPEYITSFKNPKIQHIRDLLTSRKSREEQHVCVIEGVRLAEEAVNAPGQIAQMAVFSEKLSARGMELVNTLAKNGCQLIKVPQDLMARISATEADQGLLMVIETKLAAPPKTLEFVLILDELKDPGNMGTILRTAAAAGVQLLITTPGCVDVYAPKVMRAGMGAHFRLALAALDWTEISKLCQSQTPPLPLFLAEAAEGTPIWKLNLAQALGIIIGGEADGASAAARAAATGNAGIPMPGGSESLNAAIAAGILLFEVVRQRSA